MDEKDLELTLPEQEPEFDLDDILKEFALEPGEALEAAMLEAFPEEAPAETPEEQPEEEPAEGPAQQPAEMPAAEAEAVTGDTIRLDRITVDTAANKVRDAAPIVEEEEPQTPEEPFSEQWEPEYEQPMGRYVPPQPILIHPRSRLRELKRKLVAGPEKRYYALTEKGVGKLQAAIFLSVLVVLLSAGATVMYAMGAVQPDRLRLMIFGQFFAMMLSALVGSFELIEGVANVFRGRFTVKTLLVLTFLACCADAVLCLRELRVPCCAAFSLEMTLALCNSYQERSAEMGQMDTMRKAVRLDSLCASPDYYDGRKGLLRGEGEVEDFMDHYQTVPGPEKILSWYAILAFLAAAAIGVFAGLRDGLSAGIQVAAVSLLAATPATVFVSLSRPSAILTKRLHAVGAVICGWQGVEGLSGKAVFPLAYSDLFPTGSARMNGVKFYGSRQPDEIVAYGTAVITANNSGLTPIFQQVLDSRNGRHYDVTELRCYDNGGIGAIVQDEPVLVGPLHFLKQMGVDVPDGIRVDQSVCVAIDGELCALFALTYENNRGSAVGLSSLCSSRKVRPIVTSDDFLLTEEFIRSRFSVKFRNMVFPEHALRSQLREKQPDADQPALALVTRTGLTGYAYAIAGARALRTASRWGVAVHILGGVVGLAAMLTLTLLGRLDLLTPANLFAYQLVWMIPGFLITEWTRAC